MGRKSKGKKQQHHGPQNQHAATNHLKEPMCKIPTPLPVRIEPDAKHNEEYGEERDSRGAQLRTAQRLNWITAIGGGAAIVLALLTYLQWHDLRHNFIADQRAWLSAAPPTGSPTSSPVDITFPITNTGKTVAKNVVVFFNGKYVDHMMNKIDFSFDGDPQPIGYIAPNSPSAFHYIGDPIPATADTFIIYGAITYDDVYSSSGHWLTYCFYFTKNSTYGYCREHNQMGDGPLPAGEMKR